MQLRLLIDSARVEATGARAVHGSVGRIASRDAVLT